METVKLELEILQPGENKLYFYNEITSETAKDFIKDFHKLSLELNNLDKINYNILKQNLPIIDSNIYQNLPIEIHLNSIGGFCYDGFAIYDNLNTFTSRPIHIFAEGIVASMGIVILCSVPVEKRYSTKNTIFMIHSVSNCIIGKIGDLKESIQHTETLQKMLWNIISSKTKIPMQRLIECEEKKEDWFLTASEALEYGLISKII